MDLENMFLENQSKYNFEETIAKLEEEVKNASWGLIHVHDLQGILKGKGFDVKAVQVFEVCKPTYANQLLSNDELRIYSNLMPCRLSVYEKEDGKTYISRMNNGMFAGLIGGEAKEVMSGAYEEVENFVANLVL